MERFFPKTANASPALPGSLHAEFVRCGKATCRCARGELHGPYWKRHWSEGGRMHKTYVPLSALPEVAAACARHQAQHPSGRALRRLLRAYNARLSEVLATLQQGDVAGNDGYVGEGEAQP